MKKILIITATSIALCAGLPNSSIADEAPTSMGGASVDATLADLQRRIEELEARVGGKTPNSNLQPQNSAFRNLRRPTKASSPD